MKIYKIIVAIFLMFELVSCSQEEDIAPVDSPEDNATITVTPKEDYSTVKEGDTLIYSITTDKMFKNAISFDVSVGDDTNLNDSEYAISGGTFPAYSESTDVEIILPSDDLPEVSEVLNFSIDFTSDIARNYQLTEESANLVETYSINVTNVNDPDAITVAFSWEDPEEEIDFDMFVENMDLGTWSTDGATGNNPEIDLTVRNDYSSPYDGTYEFAIDPFSVPDGDVNFTVTIGYPDGSLEEFKGVWNSDDAGSYSTTTISAYGFDAYTILSVVKSGNTYDVSFEF